MAVGWLFFLHAVDCPGSKVHTQVHCSLTRCDVDERFPVFQPLLSFINPGPHARWLPSRQLVMESLPDEGGKV